MPFLAFFINDEVRQNQKQPNSSDKYSLNRLTFSGDHHNNNDGFAAGTVQGTWYRPNIPSSSDGHRFSFLHLLVLLMSNTTNNAFGIAAHETMSHCVQVCCQRPFLYGVALIHIRPLQQVHAALPFATCKAQMDY